MSCTRTFEIDLEDLLAQPGSAELAELEAHSAGCADCAGELALHRGLLARLKGEDTRSKLEHPADAALLRLRRDPDALSDAERSKIRAHLRDCRPCDDAFRATAMLVPEPRTSPLARLVETLRGALLPGALPAWAPAALALVLASGLFLTLDPFGLRVEDPGPIFRGAPSERVTEVELELEDRGELSLYGLADDDVVRLRFALPEALRGASLVRGRISIEGGAEVGAGLLEIAVAEGVGSLETAAGVFERDSYEIELSSPEGGSHTYRLDVR